MYVKVLTLLATTEYTSTEVAKLLNISVSVVTNILGRSSHLYLKTKFPELYTLMEEKNRACGRQKAHNQEQYVSTLFLLANTDRTTESISKDVGLPLSILYDISKGQSHTYLKDLYPEEYEKLLSKKGSFSRGRKEWPKVRAPDGTVHEIFNSAKFAKEHRLDTGGFSRLLNGKQKTQKGWMLCS